jgi:restriction system protein
MAENSLFAMLLRSPWWISLVIALALGAASFALLPKELRVVGALSGIPFIVIAGLALRRQWHLPSVARVAETQAALSAMAWPAFAGLLEESFQREGYAVERGKADGVDFALERKGRRLLVCARRWKSARTGLEALRALQAAREADDDGPEALYIGLAALTDTARAFAAEHRIAVWHAGELAHALRDLPLGRQRLKA